MSPNYESLLKHLSLVPSTPIGLVSHQASPVAGFLYNTFGSRLACLFAPEHGWFGVLPAGEESASSTHPFWNIPIHSLYGEARTPTPEMLAGLGRLVIDLQDIGVRCFTYLATLKNVLEAASRAGLSVTVLDRPIPLGGTLDGPMRELIFSSFVAPLNIPFCHGMTPGECAQYIVQEEKLDLDLTVIKVKDWSHTKRTPWTNFMPPSPALCSWDSAVLYPATVFTEAFPALDCDRAGNLAFRVIGAPWLDVAWLLDHFMDAIPACGLGVRPIQYTPSSGAYAGKLIPGLLFSIENPDAFYPVTAGTIVLAALLYHHPTEMMHDSRLDWLDKLVGSTDVRKACEANQLGQLFQSWIDAQDAFLAKRVDLYA